MEGFKEFISKYRGAIIGAIIAIIALILQIYKAIIAVLIIIVGIVAGNYIQYNKELVKIRLKEFIDKL